MGKRVGGKIFVKADGFQFDAKGQFEYNLGADKRDVVLGHDGVHGHKALPQEPYISGEITDNYDLDLKNDVLNIEDATITLELYNGKTIVLRQAFYSGEGTVQTEEGNIAVRFTGISAAEVK